MFCKQVSITTFEDHILCSQFLLQQAHPVHEPEYCSLAGYIQLSRKLSFPVGEQWHLQKKSRLQKNTVKTLIQSRRCLLKNKPTEFNGPHSHVTMFKIVSTLPRSIPNFMDETAAVMEHVPHLMMERPARYIFSLPVCRPSGGLWFFLDLCLFSSWHKSKERKGEASE